MRAFKKREGSRRSFFEQIERGALRPLPERPYQYATWKKARVHLDYHIEVERAYYSVPYKLIGQSVDVRLAAHTLQIFHRGKLMAARPRAVKRGTFSTHGEHRPREHTAVVELTHERLIERARSVGAGHDRQCITRLNTAPAGMRRNRCWHKPERLPGFAGIRR